MMILILSYRFLFKHGNDANGEVQSSEITIYEYFKRHKKIELCYSVDMPCINVGKPKRPIYYPMEVIQQKSIKYFILRKIYINCFFFFFYSYAH